MNGKEQDREVCFLVFFCAGGDYDWSDQKTKFRFCRLFCLHEKLKSVTGESSSLSIVLNVLLKKQMMSMSSRSFSLLSLNFPVRASYLNQVFNSITNQYDVYIYELLSTL